MKVRTIPYGYKIVDGNVAVAENESQAVKNICSEYMAGSSLLEIAERLNRCKIEYMKGVINWNKARIKRIIEDSRYTGNDSFPAIIDRETYDTIQSIKNSRNTQKETNRKADIFQISTKVRCPHCGAEMQRRVNRDAKIHQRWICKNCKLIIGKSDTALLSEITELLNDLITNPDKIQVPSEANEPNIEQRKLENEIGRTLDTAGFDKDALRSKLLEFVSLKYANIDLKFYKAKRLKADFEKSGLLSEFSTEFFNRTVSEIQLTDSGDVRIVLKNGQIIGKEQRENASSTDSAAEENRAGNRLGN